MSRRSPDKKKNPEVQREQTLPVGDLQAEEVLSPLYRRIASACIVLQVGVLVLSLSANLSPSYLQGMMLDWAELYTISVGQDYGAVAVELTHGESLDFPVAIQVQSESDDAGEWTTLSPPGVQVSDKRPVNWSRSRWPNLSRAVRLLYNDTEDTEALAILATAAIHGSSNRRLRNVSRVRIVSPTVLNYEQYSTVMQAGYTVGEAYDDEVIYTASLVRLAGGEMVLVPDEEPLKTSKSNILQEVAP